MITVKLYGLLRIESGIREVSVQAKTVQDVLHCLGQRGIPKSKTENCIILVNGKSAGKRSKLADGDTVVLMPPVAGG